MIVSFIPALKASVLESGTATGVKIPQGAVIQPGVLDVVFMDGQGNYVSPSEIRYKVAAVDSDGVEHVIGNSIRIPYEVRIGRFSPNMQIGDDWYTGQYHLNWEYKLKSTDSYSVRTIGFEVVSSGVYDVRLVGLGLFNVKATVIVV